MPSNAEEQANASGAAMVHPSKATKRANAMPRKHRVARGKPRSGKKASSAKRRPKREKAAKADEAQARVREERGRAAPLYRSKVDSHNHANKEPPRMARRFFFVRFQVGPEAISHERLRSYLLIELLGLSTSRHAPYAVCTSYFVL